MTKRILLLSLITLVSLSTFAQTKADTIAIDQSFITKWIADTTLIAKGKTIIKYYCLYKGQLVSTNKTTLQNVALCNKYKVKCALILITSKTGRQRITSN